LNRYKYLYLQELIAATIQSYETYTPFFKANSFCFYPNPNQLH
jgi:hypothetical protein